MAGLVERFVQNEEGQDLIEYGLLAATLALCVVSLLTALGGDLRTLYGNIGSQVTGAS